MNEHRKQNILAFNTKKELILISIFIFDFHDIKTSDVYIKKRSL